MTFGAIETCHSVTIVTFYLPRSMALTQPLVGRHVTLGPAGEAAAALLTRIRAER